MYVHTYEDPIHDLDLREVMAATATEYEAKVKKVKKNKATAAAASSVTKPTKVKKLNTEKATTAAASFVTKVNKEKATTASASSVATTDKATKTPMPVVPMRGTVKIDKRHKESDPYEIYGASAGRTSKRSKNRQQ